MSSRNSNAKLLQFTRGREQKRSASSMSKAFTSKQSHYARRSEEDAIRRESIADSDSATAALRSAGPTTPSYFEGAHHKTSGQIEVAARRAAAGGSRKGARAFSLNDAGDDALTNGARGGGGGLGARTAAVSLSERNGETGEPIAGKRARFEQMMDRVKDERAEKKVLRNESERETDQLDRAFGDIESLLETKTKRQEAQDAFYVLGSEETRAKLAKFYEQRRGDKGREFVLTAGAKKLIRVGVDDDAAAAPIRPADKVEARQKLKELKQQQKNPSKQLPAAADPDAVDPRVARLLASAGSATNEDDGFDKLMGQMIFSKKAHAGDKIYDGDDALLDQFQEELLGVDQQRRAAAGLLVPDVADVTRREWIQRGGDDVYRMGREEEEAAQDDDGAEDGEDQCDDDDDNGDEVDIDALDDDEDFDFDRPDAVEQFKRLKEQQKKASDKKAATASSKAGSGAAASASSGLNAVDESLMRLEKTLNECLAASSSSNNSADKLQAALDSLHETCALRPRMAAESFRLLFLDISTQFQSQLRGDNASSSLSPFQLLVLRAATQMFPMSDVSRHPVAAPLSLLLPSLMFYSPPLNTPADAASLLFLASTMMDLLRGGGGGDSNSSGQQPQQQRKPFFSSEPFLAICNVLALQLPLSALAPGGKTARMDAPFPVLHRAAEAVFSPSAAARASTSSCLSLSELLSLVHSTRKNKSGQQQQQQLQQQSASEMDIVLSSKVLATAYDLAENFICTFLAHSPSAPALISPCIMDFFTTKLGGQFQQSNSNGSSSSNNQRQQKLHALCEKIIAEIEGERAPLAMRTFRPRPLRIYEPLLVDDSATEVKDRRTMKKELREGKKRVIRSVQATAAVERRQQEREFAAEDAHRSGKLKELMSELQGQQQTMKIVDMHKAKAKSKKKTKISGAPTGDPSGAEGGDDE